VEVVGRGQEKIQAPEQAAHFPSVPGAYPFLHHTHLLSVILPQLVSAAHLEDWRVLVAVVHLVQVAAAAVVPVHIAQSVRFGPVASVQAKHYPAPPFPVDRNHHPSLQPVIFPVVASTILLVYAVVAVASAAKFLQSVPTVAYLSAAGGHFRVEQVATGVFAVQAEHVFLSPEMW
jgi:hypothetical protein